MPLLKLPAEILLDIFGRVGSSFFYEHIDHLVISKQWYAFARQILYLDFRLSTKFLSAFNDSMKSEHFREDFVESIRGLSFTLERHDVRTACCNEAKYECTDSKCCRSKQKSWRRALNQHAFDLEMLLGGCPKLRKVSLTLCAWTLLLIHTISPTKHLALVLHATQYYVPRIRYQRFERNLHQRTLQRSVRLMLVYRYLSAEPQTAQGKNAGNLP